MVLYQTPLGRIIAVGVVGAAGVMFWMVQRRQEQQIEEIPRREELGLERSRQEQAVDQSAPLQAARAALRDTPKVALDQIDAYLAGRPSEAERATPLICAPERFESVHVDPKTGVPNL